MGLEGREGRAEKREREKEEKSESERARRRKRQRGKKDPTKGFSVQSILVKLTTTGLLPGTGVWEVQERTAERWKIEMQIIS